MTAAVCLRCGAIKVGAFAPCPECHHAPTDEEDRAEHLLATDRFLDPEQLAAISERAGAGLPVNFPPELLEEMRVAQETIAAEMARAERIARGCLIALGVAILLAVLGVVLALGWLGAF